MSARIKISLPPPLRVALQEHPLYKSRTGMGGGLGGLIVVLLARDLGVELPEAYHDEVARTAKIK